MLLDPLEVLTQQAGGGVATAIGAFSVLAIATSFIGTTLGERLRPTKADLDVDPTTRGLILKACLRMCDMQLASCRKITADFGCSLR